MADDIDDATARALARQAFPPAAGKTVYVDRTPRAKQATALGAQLPRTDKPALLVFRDEMPGANWMHPCSYALVDVHSGTVLARASSDRPPAFGRLPPSCIVASDPDGVADLVANDGEERSTAREEKP